MEISDADNPTTRMHQVEAIFFEVLALPDAARSGFLDHRCCEDVALRCEVERLLRADSRGPEFLAAPALGEAFSLPSPDAVAEPNTPRRIGPYELVRVIGSGGIGHVWLARRHDGHFEKQVAIKLIKRGMDTDEILDRFRRERQVLAGLEHPNIARLIDGGATDDGRPYLVMEHVDGLPIDRYCQQAHLSVAERLTLFREVCAAVHYAHQNLVIHRDLKPGNILVTPEGRPKLLDFGIAKVLRRESSAQTLDLTVTEARLLTPEYASPEQIRGQPLTTSSDVYALGVVLYELLTLTKPHRGPFRSRGQCERAICEIEPDRPSRLVQRIGVAAAVSGDDVFDSDWPERSADSLSRVLRGDLDTILLMALRKEPRERYVSAEQFSEDIRRYLEGMPVHARPPTMRYRAAKFVRRHRVSMAAAALAILAILVGLFASTWAYVQAEAARASEARMRRVAEDETAEAEQQRHAAEMKAYVASIAAAEASLRAGDVSGAQFNLDQAPDGLRNWEWRYLEHRLDQSLRSLAAPGIVNGLATSRDGTLLAAACQDGSIIVHNTDSWETVFAGHGQTGHGIQVAFSPAGPYFAFATRGGRVAIWNLETKQQQAELAGHTARVNGLCFSHDGSLAATASSDGTIRLWPLSALADAGVATASAPRSIAASAVLRAPRGGMMAVAFSPDDRRLVSGGADDNVRIWDVADGRCVDELEGHTAVVTSVAFSPDGQTIASGSHDHSIRLWDAETGRELRTLSGHDGLVMSVAFSPDGGQLVSGAWDKTVRVWNVATGAAVRTCLGHSDNVMCAVFSPDGGRIFSGAADRTIRVWDAQDHTVLHVDGRTERVYGLSASPEGDWIAAVYGLGPEHLGFVSLWDARTARELGVLYRNPPATPHAPRHELKTIAASPDGAFLAAESGDGNIRLWTMVDVLARIRRGAGPGATVAAQPRILSDETVRQNGHLRPETFTQPLAFSPDGRRLASGHCDGVVRVWRVDGASSPLRIDCGPVRVMSITFDAGGDRIVVGTMENGVQVMDAVTGHELLRGDVSGGTVQCLACSADGRWLAAGSDDATIDLWDCRSWRRVATLRGHTGSVHCLAFNRDGSRLVSGSDDRTLKLWEVPSGQEVATLHGHAYHVSAVQFVGDDERLVSCSGDGTIRSWNAAGAPGRDLNSKEHHPE